MEPITPTAQGPTVIRCRLCGVLLSLGPDNEPSRAAGRDPAEQLRRHLGTHPVEALELIQRTMAWFIDTLCFEGADQPSIELWQRHQGELLDFVRTHPVVPGAPRPEDLGPIQ